MGPSETVSRQLWVITSSRFGPMQELLQDHARCNRLLYAYGGKQSIQVEGTCESFADLIGLIKESMVIYRNEAV
jgi:hypothetical protein